MAKRRFTKYPSNYVRASSDTNKVLKIKGHNDRIESYLFKYKSGEGDVFEPETGSGNWWTSYIVTPDNRLLSWQLSGRYTSVDAVYGEDFWVECGYVKASSDFKHNDEPNIENIDDWGSADWAYYLAEDDEEYNNIINALNHRRGKSILSGYADRLYDIALEDEFRKFISRW